MLFHSPFECFGLQQLIVRNRSKQYSQNLSWNSGTIYFNHLHLHSFRIPMRCLHILSLHFVYLTFWWKSHRILKYAGRVWNVARPILYNSQRQQILSLIFYFGAGCIFPNSWTISFTRKYSILKYTNWWKMDWPLTLFKFIDVHLIFQLKWLQWTQVFSAQFNKTKKCKSSNAET